MSVHALNHRSKCSEVEACLAECVFVRLGMWILVRFYSKTLWDLFVLDKLKGSTNKLFASGGSVTVALFSLSLIFMGVHLPISI